MISARERRVAYLLLGAVVCLLAGTWTAGKIAVAEMSPFALATARFGLASVLLAGWVWMRDGWADRPSLGDLPLILAMAATGVALFATFFLLGLQRAPASDGAILVPGVAPVLAASVAALSFSEQLSARAPIGLVAAVAGIILVVGPSVETTQGRLVGDLLFLAAAVCWGTYTVLGRAATRRFGAINATLYATVLGTVLLVPFAVLEGGWMSLVRASTEAWLAFTYLTVGGTVVAYVLYYEGVSRIGIARASAFFLAIPVIGVALSVVLLGERPTLLALVGGGIVLASLWVIQRAPPEISEGPAGP